ncbi:MAG: choice-of-anchor D domain-containing protein [Terriglobales bacterium]
MKCDRTGHLSSLRSVSFCFCLLGMLLEALPAFAQAPQNRYLAYSTYTEPNPSQSIKGPAMAANGSGQVCVEDDTSLILINADGSFAYSKPISSLPVFKNAGDFQGVTIDSAGNCYVAGTGTIVPTPGAYQSKKPGGMYVVKFDPLANVIFATYLGGSGGEDPGGIALDPGGNIWLTGATYSNDFPVTNNAIQHSFGGGQNDAFVAELNPTGTQLLYGTYLGGSGYDSLAYEASPELTGIAVDSNGDVIVTGTTNSSDFPVLNAIQPTFQGSFSAFVTKIGSAGQLLYSTYLGESSGAQGVGIATDSAGDALVTGYTLYNGFPLVNPIPNQGSTGAFVAKLNPAGSAFVYSTLFGGVPGSPVYALSAAIQVDSQGNASFAGTVECDFGCAGITTLNPIELFSVSGLEDLGFMADLDPSGNLIFSSYFGPAPVANGSVVSEVSSLAMDSNGNVYLASAPENFLSPPLLSPVYGAFEPLLSDQSFASMVAKVALGTGASFSMPSAVQFTTALVGASEGPVAVTLFNTGTTSIDINNITTTGDFSVTGNLCPTTLVSASNCSVSLSFVPTGGGARSGTVVIDDDSPGNPHIIQLTGTGLAPGISLNPTTLTFAAQGLNTTSPAQNVTLKNTGGASLSINQIAISGANAGDFAELNTCGFSLAAGASCTISVTFTPTALGTRSATLGITDAVGIQTVALTGTGSASLGLGIPSGGSNSVTVSAGGTGKYTLSIGGGGLSGTATLTCTGAPRGAMCTVPSSENVSAASASQFSVSVSTTAPTSAAFRSKSSLLGWMWATVVIGLALVPVGGRSRRLGKRLFAILPLLLLTFLASCGGGNGGGGGSGSGGTPAGTYNLTVTATMGSTNQSQILKLIVQ